MIGGSLVCKKTIPLAICLAMLILTFIEISQLLSWRKSNKVALLIMIKIYSSAELIDDVILVLVFCDAYQCYEVWVVTDFD